MKRLPVFPLSTVLYPHALLPLRIFETRYVDMVSDCLKNGSGFGVCLIKQGQETGAAAHCFALGTCAEIIDWTQCDDGLLGIMVTGTRRFRVLDKTVRKDKLIVGEVEWLDEAHEGVELPGLEIIKQVYTDILDNYDTPYSQDKADASAAVACYRLADLLPIDMMIKQHILEAPDLQTRIEILLAVLKNAVLARANQRSRLM